MSSLLTMAERTMKYSTRDQQIFVDGQPVARIEILPGEFNDAMLADLVSAANRGLGRQGTGTAPAQAVPGFVNDIDETGAGAFLAAHHVPIIGPEMGMELIKVVKRLEVVHGVYPLLPLWRSIVSRCISYYRWRQNINAPSAQSWRRRLANPIEGRRLSVAVGAAGAVEPRGVLRIPAKANSVPGLAKKRSA